MRVRQLHLDQHLSIAFHPVLTVVTGLDAQQRAAVADAVAERSVNQAEVVSLSAAASVAEVARADQARAELAAAEEAARTARAVPDASLVAELERAHHEVEVTEAAATRLLAGRRARRRYEEALAVEREVLDRLGHGSYNEVMVARAAPALDLAAETRLLAARDAAAAAEAVLVDSPNLLADHRRTALPMVIDDVFVDLDGDEIAAVLAHLTGWSDEVQVIWLTDDPAVVACAEVLGPERAAIVRTGRSAVSPTV